MSDEDSEDEGEIRCPICGSPDACEHQLFFYDVTFGETMAGVVDKDELERMIATAFVTAIKEGTTPDWYDPEISELFERIDEAYTAEVLTAEEPWLPDWLPIRVLIELLEDAGGREGGGGHIRPSGGRCDSAVRALYAKKPEVVYEKAKSMLAARLEKDLHPKRRRKKKEN
jgi:hypothetical protein